MLTLTSDYANKTYYNCWGYTDDSGTRTIISRTPNAEGHPYITNNMVGGYTLYRQYGVGFEPTDYSGYYVEATKSTDLKAYFAKIMQDITTNVTTDIVLNTETILRDILNEGLVFTDNTVITASIQKGVFNTTTESIDWDVDANGKPVTTQLAKLELRSGSNTASGSNTDPETGAVSNVQINIFNQDPECDLDYCANTILVFR